MTKTVGRAAYTSSPRQSDLYVHSRISCASLLVKSTGNTHSAASLMLPVLPAAHTQVAISALPPTDTVEHCLTHLDVRDRFDAFCIRIQTPLDAPNATLCKLQSFRARYASVYTSFLRLCQSLTRVRTARGSEQVQYYNRLGGSHGARDLCLKYRGTSIIMCTEEGFLHGMCQPLDSPPGTVGTTRPIKDDRCRDIFVRIVPRAI